MLLPSGRSNSDVYPQQNSNKPSFATSASSPILYDKLNESSNIRYKNENVSKLEAQEEKTAPKAFINPLELTQVSLNGSTSNVDVNETIPNNIPAQFMLNSEQNQEIIGEIESQLNLIQNKLEEGWTVHIRQDGRLYYCNHLTRTASWLPSIEDWIKTEDLLYGWERAIDTKGRSYYINHQNKTTTYEEPENVRQDENPPQQRVVVLERSPNLGFGFVAGSERPVLVRFITEGGPSINKLLPGDQILAVNGEDVKEAPRDHVIHLIRACETQVTLLVCQPLVICAPGRKSTLLSAGKRAKLKSRPNRVRFAESVCVNGAPLFPPSAFSLSDICVPPMANVLKVFLENGQTKSFKYDTTTTVQDVMNSLIDKLCLKTPEIFSLVLEHVKSLKRNKFSLLDPEESLAKIAARPGAHKLRCLFRVTFVPNSTIELAQKDINALDYLYMQCCNDVTQERFAPELQPEMALRLATLQMQQHALTNCFSSPKLSIKLIEREFGLERFLPPSLLDGMKRKELRRLLTHFHLEMVNSLQKSLTLTQAKINYLEIIATLPSYGAKCFSTNQRIGVERVILVGPRFGLSQITNARNSVPQAISSIEDLSHIVINNEDELNYSVGIFMKRDRVVKFSMEDRDANELSLVIAGYYRLLTGNVLTVIRERKNDSYNDDNAPPYLAQHTVLPSFWSYPESFHDRTHSINFFTSPSYHFIELRKSPNGSANFESTGFTNCKMIEKNNCIDCCNMTDWDIHSVLATELLEEAKDSGLSDSSGGGSNYCEQQKNRVDDNGVQVLLRVQEMQKMVESSEQYLSEQGETSHACTEAVPITEVRNDVQSRSNASIWNDLDSDSESLNSSKVAYIDESMHQGALNHSDSLVLLAEIINKDLSGITHELNSINENSVIENPIGYSSKFESRDKTLSQLLNNIQLNLDNSQSESDAESILSPLNSPTSQRYILPHVKAGKIKTKNMAVFRGSFGLHSPDDDYYSSEGKNSRFNDLENSNDKNDMKTSTTPQQKLPEVLSTVLMENETDLIDLRAIPPPRTPDDLDAFSLVNAPPQGFDDDLIKNTESKKQDLDAFLEKVVVVPPIQKNTPSKELTPEEIMSFIIPPPPNLDTEANQSETNHARNNLVSTKIMENFYSNSASIHQNFSDQSQRDEGVIDYATIERKPTFFCCPKTRKIEDNSKIHRVDDDEALRIPPRQILREKEPPIRPPKSADLIKRYSPKKTLDIPKEEAFVCKQSLANNSKPPNLPPRLSKCQIEIPIDRLNSNSPATIHSPIVLMSPPASVRSGSYMTPNKISSDSITLPQSPPQECPKFMPHRGLNSLSENESPIFSKIQYNAGNNRVFGEKIIIKNGHIIDAEALLAKTEVAMAGLLVKLDQIAGECAAAQSAGGGANIDEDKFQQARSELTEQTLSLVTASKFLVISMSDATLHTLPEHLTSCLTALRRITELTQHMTRHTSAPLQTRNIVLKVHDVASSFRELVQVDVGPLGAGQLALQAECLANVLATLLRSLRVFSP